MRDTARIPYDSATASALAVAERLMRCSIGCFLPEQGRRDYKGSEFAALRQYPRALRLTSELTDLRAADADRIPLRAKRGRSRVRC